MMKENRLSHGASAAIAPLVREEQRDRKRIVTLKQGKLQPMQDRSPSGAPCPSRSLAIERFEQDQPQELLHTLVHDMVSLFVKPAYFSYQIGQKPANSHFINSGEAVICARSEEERLTWHSPVDALCVQLSPDVLKETSRSLLKCEQARLKPTMGIVNPGLTTLLWAIDVEQRRGYPGGRLFVDSLESALAIRLVTDFSVDPATPRLAKGGLAPHQLRRVLEFMDQNLHTSVGLADLAAVAGLSPSHFSSQFRASVGVSPYKYVRALRIDRSKNMLKKPDAPIAQIAKIVGFDNQQHFSTVFRSVVGVTPTTYRAHL
jgi:AraC family transcriptional regulator